MKTLLNVTAAFLGLLVGVFLSITVFAQDITSHKTEDGKYPYYFDDQGHPEVWTEVTQKDYDQKMLDTIKKYCADATSLGNLETQYSEAERQFYSDAKNKDKFFTNVEMGKKMELLKAEAVKLSNVIVKGTGLGIQSWGCQ